MTLLEEFRCRGFLFWIQRHLVLDTVVVERV